MTTSAERDPRRPPAMRQTGLRMPHDIMAKIDAEAAIRNTTASQIVREALEDRYAVNPHRGARPA